VFEPLPKASDCLTSQSHCIRYTHGGKVAFRLLTQLILEGRPREESNTILRFSTTVGRPATLREIGDDESHEVAIKEISERPMGPVESYHN
jgi:glycerol dehydrogenase-like iron-containing ADH family enzyme